MTEEEEFEFRARAEAEMQSDKPAVSAAPVAPKKSKVFGGGDAAAFEGAGELAAGVPETALSMATGAAASVGGGLRGIYTAGKEIAGGTPVSEALAKGGQVVKDTQEKFTFRPRSEQGKDTSEISSLPMEVAKKLLGKAGGALGKVAGNEAAGESIGESTPEALAALLGAKTALRPTKAVEAMPGKDFSPLRTMSPEEGARFQRLKSGGVDPTLGQVTRDPAQVRYEQQTAQLPEGARIAQRNKENEQALSASIEKLKDGPDVKGAQGLSETETGRSVRTALEAKAAAGKQVINDKYEKARASGETKELIELDPLERYLDEHKAEAISVPKLASVRAMVDELKTVNKGSPGHATIDQIENLRQRVGELAQGDGSVKKYMGDLRAGIDKMTEGKGGDLYKEARKARKEWGDEFEEKAGNAAILDKKSRTDYRTAVEDVWQKTIVNGSIDDLGNVIESLRTSKGPQVQASTQALKEMQSRTIDHLGEEAVKGGSFSPANLQKAIRNIGSEKLDLLLGRDAVDSLTKTLQNAKDVKTNPVRAPGSDTFLNQQTMARKIASEHVDHLIKGVLPRFAGRILDSVRERASARAGRLRQSQAVDEALTPNRASLQDIQKQADAVKSRRSSYLLNEAGTRVAAQIPMASDIEDRK